MKMRTITKRSLAIVLLFLLSSTLTTGCSEDTESVERNLYYDMERVDRRFATVLEDALNDQGNRLLEMIMGNEVELDTEKHLENIDNLEESLEGIEFPRHLREEGEVYSEISQKAVEELRYMIESDFEEYPSSEVLEFFDHEYKRIYSGFREFEID